MYKKINEMSDSEQVATSWKTNKGYTLLIFRSKFTVLKDAIRINKVWKTRKQAERYALKKNMTVLKLGGI